jgi:hypothetical protein
MALFPLGTVPLGALDGDTAIGGASAVSFATGGELHTRPSLASASTVAITSSASLTTAINLAASPAIAFATHATAGDQQIFSSDTRIGFTEAWASLDPVTRLYLSIDRMQFGASATLSVTDAFRTSTIVPFFSPYDYAILDVDQIFVGGAQMSVVTGLGLLTTDTRLKSLGTLARITSDGALTLQKIFDNTADSEGLVFGASAELMCGANLQTSATVHLGMQGGLTTDFDLQATGTLMAFKVDAGIRVGALLHVDTDPIGSFGSSARLSIPAPGTVFPWMAEHVAYDITFELGGAEYSGFASEARIS